MDLYAEEVKVWKECRELRDCQNQAGLETHEDTKTVDSRNDAGDKDSSVKEVVRKIPGAFEW